MDCGSSLHCTNYEDVAVAFDASNEVAISAIIADAPPTEQAFEIKSFRWQQKILVSIFLLQSHSEYFAS